MSFTNRLIQVTFLTLAVALAPKAQAAPVVNQGTWEVSLQGRDLDGDISNGFEAYYDTDLDITWLANMNLATTDSSWIGAKNLASGLNLYGIAGWRLPMMVDTGLPGCDYSYGGTDCGYNIDINSSELAHMFYTTLGNTAYLDQSGSAQPSFGMKNTGPFHNHSDPIVFWLGNSYPSGTDAFAWAFDSSGAQYGTNAMGAAIWVVHSGDISAVPEPSTFLLLFIGLSLVFFRKLFL
ncbi:PEP-CTERM sorting domain-containing protein [Parasulfuritortus cantonensis]|uniref:PEP-CTERM sorting domain-containing protein n=1 Tax=Parasulfuritortus cantonensis TaxID=2528202 RepID=A0A4R1B8Y2_9PROT|nr:PEP-CTERM sorting domain-containing protein [Parasulfuritortus cantonensis]TCJ12769.1 PEP-CTERM sorting domain-containing protein [Parasulfuritortus cantonensis]